MANPLEPVEYATIVGRFMVASTDSDDLGDEPDIIAATGQGRFLPSVSHILVAGATPPATIKLAPVDFEFDEQGYISNPITKERGVRVVAPTDAVNPTGFTYRVTFDAGTSFLGFDFSVPAGGTVDLTRVGRVAQNGGAPITRGEPGVGVAAIVLADDEASLQITYDNGLVRVVPVPALDEARVARDEAVEAATNAVAPTRTAIAQALVDPDSEARAALNATYRNRVTVTNYGIWVSPTGSDTNDGLSEATALKTLQAAHDRASMGDTIRLARGIHKDVTLVTTKSLTIIGTGSPINKRFPKGHAWWNNPPESELPGAVLRPPAGSTEPVISVRGFASINPSYGTVLRDLTIAGFGTGVGLKLGGVDPQEGYPHGDILVRARVSNVVSANFDTAALANIENSDISGLYVFSSNVGLKCGGACNGNHFSALNVERCVQVGLWIAGNSVANLFSGGVLQANEGVVVRCGPGAVNNRMVGMYFENSTATKTAEMLAGSVANVLDSPEIYAPASGAAAPITIDGANNGFVATRDLRVPVDFAATAYRCFADGNFPATVTPAGGTARPTVQDLAAVTNFNRINAVGFNRRFPGQRLLIDDGFGINFGPDLTGASVSRNATTGALQLYGGGGPVQVIGKVLRLGNLWLRESGGVLQVSPDGVTWAAV